MVSIMDIIFLTLLVAFIVKRLYSVFGANTKESKLRIIIKPHNPQIKENVIPAFVDIKEAKDLLESNSQDITAKIPNFNKNSFLSGAKRVFELVLSSFNSGNLNNIKNLVSPKIFNALNSAVEKRVADHLSSEVDFIGFDSAEIKSVKFLKNSVKIVVDFVSQQVNILKDKDGNIILGDENFVQKIADTWTFERPLNADAASWKIVSTKKSD
ncbi:MAG: Tim44/TimA family putative adaptor protein [Alphaproteobacteria bacterium]|nr:Tim44/TimA family putative adaptor protein [Alphaproteobacteria bacterium]